MRLLFLCVVVLFSGCVNSNNLSFNPKKPHEFQVTYDCKVSFDDMRFYGQFINKNTTKTVYYVDHKKVIESRFELIKTSINTSDFSLDDYIQMLHEDAHVEFLKKDGGIVYVRFVKRGTLVYQLISASSDQLDILNVEDNIFDVLYQQCVL
jgi:hypothetical protein